MQEENIVLRKPLLSNLFGEIRKKDPDFGKIGVAWLDISSAIVGEGLRNTDINYLRIRWNDLIGSGSVLTQSKDPNIFGLQKDIRELVNLNKPYESYIFYVIGGGGVIRIMFYNNSEGILKAELTENTKNPQAIENFNLLH